MTTRLGRKQAPQRSLLISVLSLALIAFVLSALILWHAETKGHEKDLSGTGKTEEGPRSRLLLQRSLGQSFWESSQPDIDDDSQRDTICLNYLEKFLNGTTDAKDECDAMFNAYTAADCKDDKQISLWDLIFHHRRHHYDDDVVIDDKFENWHCCYSINEYYEKHCQEAGLNSFKLLVIVSILVFCGFIKSMIRTFEIEWLPEAAACILVGATVGGIVKLINPSFINGRMVFDNDFFLHILLPPIIFQQSLSIDKRAFRRDLFPILSFAVLGTVMSAVVIGYITHWITSIGRGTTLPLLDSLLFGSLISSIDPVATLGILTSIGVGPTDTLYTLIFGESLLNDGVAIVLFDTLVKHLGDEDVVTQATLHESITMFFRVSFGSIGIGLACGIVSTLYFYFLRRRHASVVEVGIFFMWALIPFYISDGINYSGIISIMTMGFVVDYFIVGGSLSEEEQWMDYMELRGSEMSDPTAVDTPRSIFRKIFNGRGHMSSKSRHHVKFVADVISSIMETAIFAYLGLFLFSDNHTWDFRLNTTAIFGCVLSRALMVVIVSAAINFFVWIDLENKLAALCTRPQVDLEDDESFGGSTARVYLTQQTQQVLFLAGVRGAVSFALVENIPVYDAVRKTGSHFKLELKAMASVSILFTVFVFGAFTYRLLTQEKERHDETSPLAQRLLSDPLNSDNDDDSRESPSAYAPSSTGAP